MKPIIEFTMEANPAGAFVFSTMRRGHVVMVVRTGEHIKLTMRPKLMPDGSWRFRGRRRS